MENGAEHTCLGNETVVKTVIVAGSLGIAHHAGSGILYKLIARTDTGRTGIPVVARIPMVARVVGILHHSLGVAAPVAYGIIGHTILIQAVVEVGIVPECVGQICVAIGKEAAGHVVVSEHTVGLKREVDFLVEIVVARCESGRHSQGYGQNG